MSRIAHTLIALMLSSTTPSFGLAQSANIDGLGDAYEIAQNQTAADVLGGLERQGYVISDMSQTLLGRTKIVATNPDHTREVVVSRTTGEVLSDTINNTTSAHDSAWPKLTFGGKVTFTWNSNRTSGQ